MSTSEKAAHWWAPTSLRARLTTVGAVILVGGLVTTSAIVWNSPSNPVAEAITDTITDETEITGPADDREELLAELATLESELEKRDDKLAAATARTAKMQQKLWSAEGLIDAMEKSRGSGGGSGGGDGGGDGGGAAEEQTASGRAPSPWTSTSPSPLSPSTPTTPAPGAPTPTRPSPAPPLTTLTKADIVAPSSAYLGLYTEQAPFNWATYDLTSTKVGSTPNVVGYFGGWDEDFRANAVTRAWERGAVPILTWESRPIGSANDVISEPEYSLPRILGDPEAGVPGAFDDYLREYAQDIVDTGLPMGIRLNHEMNGDWYPWSEMNMQGESINGNRRGDYVKTWQHVHDIFEEEGANDLVFWIWAPNRVDRLPPSHQTSDYLDSLYPGDEYVDWVGMSAYLRPPFQNGQTYDFDYTYDATLDELRRITSKPIFLAEIGASEIGGHKAEWITSMFENLAEPENSDIVGLAWFNLSITSYVQGQLATNDWRIDARASSVTAFREGLALPGSRFDLDPK